MRLRLLLSCAVLALLLPSPSQAGGKDARIEIRPYAGFRFGGGFSDSGYGVKNGQPDLVDDLDVKPGGQFGIMLNVPISLLGAYDRNNNWHLETFFTVQSSTLRIDDRTDFDLPLLNENFKRDGDKIELFDMDVTYIHIGGLHQWTGGSYIPYLNFGPRHHDLQPR